MKRYLATSAFSLSEKVLITTDTIFYAEPVRMMTHVYSATTKKFLGKVSSAKFLELAKEV